MFKLQHVLRSVRYKGGWQKKEGSTARVIQSNHFRLHTLFLPSERITLLLTKQSVLYPVQPAEIDILSGKFIVYSVQR